MRTALIAVAALSLCLGPIACQSSHEEGVKTSYRSQWTNVSADPEDATEAARAVLEAEGLKEVQANSTNVDGTATGKMADGTKVNVAIARQKNAGSEVSVTVGTMGDPVLGAEIARKIKERADGTAREAGDRTTTRPS
jgi:hypothetical protein